MAVHVVTVNNLRRAVATIATDTGTWGNDGGGGGTSDEPDIVYQTTTAQSRKVSTSRIGRAYTHGSGTSFLTADRHHCLLKVNATNSAALLTRTSPALGVKIGSGSSAHFEYYLFGSDNYPARGGWQLVPLSARVCGYRDVDTGNPDLTSALYWSLLSDFSASSKSENLCIDAIDIGAGLAISRGDSTDPDCTFDDLYDDDEGTAANRYGYLYAEGPILLANGELAIGQGASRASTVTEFTDATGGTLVWQNGYAEEGFHKLLVDLGTSGTVVDIDDWTFQSIGKAANDADRSYTSDEDTRTQLEVTGSTGSLTLDGVTVSNFSKITLTPGCAVADSTLECASLVQGSADIENCNVKTLSVAEEATLTDPTFGTTTDLNNTTFTQAGTGHAVQLDSDLGSETAATWFGDGGTAATQTATTVSWPASHQADDVAFLCVETNDSDIPFLSANGSGWKRVFSVGTPDATVGTSSRLTVWWKRATSGAEANPSFSVGLGTNQASHHAHGYIGVFRGCVTEGVPWSTYETRVDASTTTTITFPDITTRIDGQLVFGVTSSSVGTPSAGFMSSITNAGLTSINERTDWFSSAGDQGGIAGFTATDTTAGSIGSTTATDAGTSKHVSAMFALRGAKSSNFEAAGTAASGTGAISPAWPAHQADDVAFLIVENEAADSQPTLSTPAGFSLVTSIANASPGTRCTVWWKRATGSSEATPTVADSGDHQIGAIITYRGLITTGEPWDAVATSVKETNTTIGNPPAVTTPAAGQLVVTIVAKETSAAPAFSSWTNANLDDYTERIDVATTAGADGGFGVADGYHNNASPNQSTGAGTVVHSSACKYAHVTLALKEAEVSWGLEEMAWTGYGANGSNSAAIWIPDQGGLYTIGVTGGTTPTITTAGASWQTQNNVNVTLNNLVVGSEVLIFETADPTNVIMALTADTTTETVSYNYVSDLPITIRVRKSSADPLYLPYEATGTITNSGFSLNVAQQPDNIAVA